VTSARGSVAMIKTYSLYEASTGLFTGKRLQCDDDGLLAAKLPPGTLAMQGAYDPLSQRVETSTGHVIAYRPLAPSGDHEWNAAAKLWQLKPAIRESDTRRAAVFARIHALETSQGRAMREATLGDVAALQRLKEIDAEIKSLRQQLG
jgi:hypothetical protein